MKDNVNFEILKRGDLNALLLLSIVENIKIKNAIISVKRVKDALVFIDQNEVEYIFDLQNLDIEAITSKIIAECKDYSCEEINKFTIVLTQSLEVLKTDLLKTIDVIDEVSIKKLAEVEEDLINKLNIFEERTTERLSNLDASKSLIEGNISVIKNSFKKYYDKSQMTVLIADTKNKLLQDNTNLQKEIENLKQVDNDIIVSVQDITDMFNSDRFSFVQDAYVKNNALFVKKNGETKRSGSFIGRIGGGSSVELYTNQNPTIVEVGCIPIGTTFLNVAHNMMWSMLLYGTKLPMFSSFAITGLKSIYEIGEKISAGNYNAIWTMSDTEILQENSIEIDYTNDSIVLAYDLDNTGSQIVTLPEISFDYVDSAIFKIKAISTSLQHVNKLLIINYMYKIYAGESSLSILTSEALKVLRIAKFDENVNGIYETQEGGFKYICYPIVLGPREEFIDESTDLEIVMSEPQILQITNDFGLVIEYYCYRTFYKLGSSLNIIVR